MRWHHFASFGLLSLGLETLSACTLGSGEGTAKGQLDVPNCWSGSFDLNPDFFAGIPYRTDYQIRVQQTADYANFADGIGVHVSDVMAVRPPLGPPPPLRLSPHNWPPRGPPLVGSRS